MSTLPQTILPNTTSVNKPRNKVHALKDYQFQEIDDKEVDVELRSANRLFGSHINLLPLHNAVQGPRLFYGARFINQAMPLINREEALVQTLSDEDNVSFDSLLGKQNGAVFADYDGVVKNVTDDEIILNTEEGDKSIPLYNNFSFNRKSSISNFAKVKKGDVVKAGSLLASSNFTNDNGVTAMGVNARIGVVPYKGYSIDDSIVVSQAFADKIASEHMYGFNQDLSDDIKLGKNHFTSIFPDKFKKDQLDKLDENGLIQIGMTVQSGDPLVLGTSPRSMSSKMGDFSSLSSAMKNARKDNAVLWDHHTPGVVTDVVKTKKGIKVNVKSVMPAQEGDKIVLRNGQKNIISSILPNDHMPRTVDGEPLEVLLNPLALPSRVNNATLYEILLGKIAKKEGKPLVLPSFNKKGDKWYDFIEKKLADNGLSDTEEVFDPLLNRKLQKPITVGNAYVMKLHHTAACYDEKTEVLTDTGWKFWKDVSTKDKLATTDPTGKFLKFDAPYHLMKYHYVGSMLGFKGRYIDYLVTPNHNHFVCAYHDKTKNFQLKQASEVHGRRFKVKQFGFTPEEVEHKPHFTVGDLEFDWDNFCELVGWWVTEGCVTKSKNASVIYQSSTANPEKLQRIKDLCSSMGLTWSPYKAHNIEMGVSIRNKKLASYLTQYGANHFEKRVPREILKGSISGVKRLLEAMISGDGNRQDIHTGPNVRFTTTSPQLADDFQEACILCGYGSIKRMDDREVYKKYKDNPHYFTTYTLSFTATRRNTQVDGDRNEEGFYKKVYTGYVYCAEMPTGLLYVRRNGKPLLSGNSKLSSRGQGSYSMDEQPVKGGGEGAQAKKVGTLEATSLISAGAYANLKESSTIRGQKNDEYWRALRMGNTPNPVGSPFVWDKFHKLLGGMGINVRDKGRGKLRLAPFTDKDLEAKQPMLVRKGDTINLSTLEPIKEGLFDPTMTSSGKWGKIPLPFPIPNPAFEGAIRSLLGLKESELRDIMAGRAEVPKHLRS